jgi:peptide methionine sulfoxide reductase MsrA
MSAPDAAHPSSDPAAARTAGLSRRGTLTAVVALAAAVAFKPRAAAAAEEAGGAGEAAAASAASGVPQTVYFGNGCFWGRQKDFVDVEKSLGRTPDKVSAIVGYAGGRKTGPDGKVCYYYGPGNSVYEKLGHAEVVQLELSDDASSEFAAFADKYFNQFVKTPFGMMRQDPQDAGPGYRNVIGLPGGVNSPLFKILQEHNKDGMQLREGDGNSSPDGAVEGDRFNTVWVLDSGRLPFHRAEAYHQFHNGIGKPFGPEYKVQQRQAAEKAGRIGDTGCPEGSFFFGI